MGLVLWLTLCMGALAFVVALNIRDVEKSLSLYGDVYSDHLNQKMVSSGVILRGFSALFGAIGSTDPGQATRYARQVVENNPHVFALEIVQAVPHSRLAEFEASQRRGGVPEFSVKSFSYDTDRKWQAPEKKPFYYPLVFMEPMPAGSEDVLGLDMDSVPFLQRAMRESLKRHTPVASHPFRLVEGNLAYVVFYPIPQGDATGEVLMVDMVIDAVNLTNPLKFPVADGESACVYHRDFSPDDPKGQLMRVSGKVRSPIEAALFPEFVYRKSLATMGEPFSLMVKRQMGWTDLSLPLLALMATLTLLSTLILLAYLKAHRQNRIQQIVNQNRLWQLANHDGLTGLPNRMLLMDRMVQILARVQRQGKRLAVMFLDLDEFKRINDTYGHEMGDELLKFVAECLRTSVRQEDTVARMSGDEFIILIEGVENAEALDAVSQKIQHNLSEGFRIYGEPLAVRTSIGVAVFPEDGDTPDALIKQADMRMYADKQARSKAFHRI